MSKKTRVAINGFGRIGRMVTRATLEMNDIEIVGINDLVPTSSLAHLLKYDSAHGHFPGEVGFDEKSVIVNGRKIPVTSEKEPERLPWKELNVDVVMECTGKFRKRAEAARHLTAGAKKVIVSAPSPDPDGTFVVGVNHKAYDPSAHHVVSNASCTTNCLAPFVKVIHDVVGIENGFMTTIHSYTNDQCIVDAPHKDLRRARAGAISQIPTSTGAAKAVGLVLPDLNGKLDGFSVRVPTLNVSCVDFVGTCKRETSVEELNAALKKASEGELKGILGYCEEPLVSVDFNGDKRSSIVDALSTKAKGKLIKILSWYDNEMAFSYRMAEFAVFMSKGL